MYNYHLLSLSISLLVSFSLHLSSLSGLYHSVCFSLHAIHMSESLDLSVSLHPYHLFPSPSPPSLMLKHWYEVEATARDCKLGQ